MMEEGCNSGWHDKKAKMKRKGELKGGEGLNQIGGL